MTVSFRGGVATFAVFLAFFGSAQLAHAGIGDVVDEAAPVAENALPNPEKTDLDNVDEAAATVDEVAGAAGAEAVVSDATAAVDAVVAEPTGVVENVVEQPNKTVADATGTVKDIVGETLGGKALDGVMKTLEPPAASPGHSAGSRDEQSAVSGASPARATSRDAAQVRTIKASENAQPSIAAAPTFERGRPGSSSVSALIDRSGTPQAQVGWTRPIMQISASPPAKPVRVSFAAPAAPYAPPPLGDQPATGASVGGAAGAALLAALFSALFFLALKTGRLARPGPILVRAKPCLSLPERPG